MVDVDEREDEPMPSRVDAPREPAGVRGDASGPENVGRDGPAAPAPSATELRADFGAHVESHYRRLVAQLYAITLDPGEAHDVVQDAYSRAWRSWSTVGRSPDPAAWVRRVAVRSTARSWRRMRERIVARAPADDGADPRTAALLAALRRLPAAERRCVVLFYMAGSSVGEIAALEGISRGSVQAHLARARHVVTDGLADVLPEVLGPVDEYEGEFR